MANHAFLYSRQRLKPGILFGHFCTSLPVIKNRFAGIDINFDIGSDEITVKIVSPDTNQSSLVIFSF